MTLDRYGRRPGWGRPGCAKRIIVSDVQAAMDGRSRVNEILAGSRRGK
jgi:hypothetical protein